jgi:ferric-dicitrate binding protein FerR (iron transport regulator)
MDVTAMGTQFNVNCYANDNASTTTTLVEGLIKVKTAGKTEMLTPGKSIEGSRFSSSINDADIEAVTAWKNGLFLFYKTSLNEVMRQLSRWYDTKIIYAKGFQARKFFTGEIKRSVSISKLLSMMELTGLARFEINNRTITILPYDQNSATR